MYNPINDLFKEWYLKQCQIEGTNNTDFVYDGSLSDTALCQHEILFVCRESNDFKPSLKKYFWLKEVINGNEKNGSKYYNCLNSIAKYIDDKISLHKCAYMNINKKGGSSKCNFANLEQYATTYKKFILREIEILNPKYIVILGKLSAYGANNAENIFLSYAEKHNIKLYIYDRHPCVYSKKVAEHIQEVNIHI